MSKNKEYILEFYPVGNYMKVSAIDVETGREVSIMGPVAAPKSELKALAIQKLEYVMAKAEEADKS